MRFIFVFPLSFSLWIYFTCEANATDKIGINIDRLLRDKISRRSVGTGGIVFKNREDISTKTQRKCQEYILEACNRTVTSSSRRKIKITLVKKTKSYLSRKKVIARPTVVGGRNSLPKEYPHMALIGYGNYSNVKWRCGGSIISEQYVLSAAHCTTTSESPPRWARLGELDLSTKKDNADPRDFAIIEIITHPEYQSPSLYNDIALFKLSASVKFNSYIRPICLNSRQDFNNSKVIATGWGSTGYGEMESPKLQTVNIFIQDHRRCESIYNNSSRLKYGFNASSMICAGYLAGGKDTCQGDSGGPLHMDMEGGCSETFSQVGITSFGEGCGFVNTPAIYTRVSFYLSWIESVVWKNE